MVTANLKQKMSTEKDILQQWGKSSERSIAMIQALCWR
jgi:hypothetical protein